MIGTRKWTQNGLCNNKGQRARQRLARYRSVRLQTLDLANGASHGHMAMRAAHIRQILAHQTERSNKARNIGERASNKAALSPVTSADWSDATPFRSNAPLTHYCPADFKKKPFYKPINAENKQVPVVSRNLNTACICMHFTSKIR